MRMRWLALPTLILLTACQSVTTVSETPRSITTERVDMGAFNPTSGLKEATDIAEAHCWQFNLHARQQDSYLEFGKIYERWDCVQ